MQLYYYPNNASLAPHLVLAEMGLDFELVLVDRKSDVQKSAEYLALNPAGRIPTLVDGELVVFESAAICLHIAEKLPDSTMVPSIGHAGRARFFQWLMYLTNTVQAELMMYFYPDRHTTDSSNSVNIVAAQEGRVTDMLDLLDRTLAGKDFLVGEDITVCDYYLLMLAVWADEFAKPPLAFEHLGRYLRQLVKRPAVQAVFAKENISLADYE